MRLKGFAREIVAPAGLAILLLLALKCAPLIVESALIVCSLNGMLSLAGMGLLVRIKRTLLAKLRQPSSAGFAVSESNDFGGR